MYYGHLPSWFIASLLSENYKMLINIKKSFSQIKSDEQSHKLIKTLPIQIKIQTHAPGQITKEFAEGLQLGQT